MCARINIYTSAYFHSYFNLVKINHILKTTFKETMEKKPVGLDLNRKFFYN
jgi:hypothetical protein